MYSSFYFLVPLSLTWNTSLDAHAQILSLLALLGVTTSLPLKLFSPGRTLLKLGSLYQVKRGSVPMHHELLLFSHCLLWLARTESHSWDWDGSWSASDSGISQNSVGTEISSVEIWSMIIWVPLQNHSQFHRRSWIGANRIFMPYLDLRWVWWRNMVRMTGWSRWSWGSCWFCSCMLVRNTCRIFF